MYCSVIKVHGDSSNLNSCQPAEVLETSCAILVPDPSFVDHSFLRQQTTSYAQIPSFLEKIHCVSMVTMCGN